MSDLLELETRRKIYDLISKNPGLHLSKIAEVLKMRTSLVEYHLIFLEKNHAIRPLKESGYTRYYVEGKISTADKKLFSIICQKVPLQIILLLLKYDILQHKDLHSRMEISASTLSYHLKKLVTIGIIIVQTYGEERGYSLQEKEEILNIILQYKPYNLFDSFEDIWSDLTV